jgi:hypothetical protein
MNIKAIVTAALVIGSSSIALATPQGGVQVTSSNSSVIVRDHRTDQNQNFYRPVYQPAPAPVIIRQPILRTLANDTKLSRWGTDKLTFARPMKLQSIKLQGETGRTTVTQVAIKFANGRTQMVQENKLLTKDGCIDIDLAGNVRNVTGIVIYGQGGLRSSFDVMGA